LRKAPHSGTKKGSYPHPLIYAAVVDVVLA
jgi:hypothetical protein